MWAVFVLGPASGVCRFQRAIPNDADDTYPDRELIFPRRAGRLANLRDLALYETKSQSASRKIDALMHHSKSFQAFSQSMP